MSEKSPGTRQKHSTTALALEAQSLANKGLSRVLFKNKLRLMALLVMEVFPRMVGWLFPHISITWLQRIPISHV